MITAIPKGIFASKFIFERSGEEVGVVKTSHWREKAEITLPGLELRASRKGFFKPTFLLERDGQVIASAVKTSACFNRLDLKLGEQTCEVKRQGFFSMTFVVLDGEEQIGYVARDGWLTHRSIIDLPDAWPLPLQFFVFWVVLVLWKRMEAATS